MSYWVLVNDAGLFWSSKGWVEFGEADKFTGKWGEVRPCRFGHHLGRNKDGHCTECVRLKSSRQGASERLKRAQQRAQKRALAAQAPLTKEWLGE